MRERSAHRRTLLTCSLALAAWAGVDRRAGAEPPASADTSVEERLKRLESVNARLLERLDRDRDDFDRRYRALEDRYNDLRRRVAEPAAAPGVATDVAPAADPAPGPGDVEGVTNSRVSHLGRPGELNREPAGPAVALRARLGEGFELASRDDEFDLRFHVLDQTDFKLFTPNARTFGKSGLYIPRVRVYFEGRLTRLWDYEVSLQRSLEGTWDLLDGNLNFHPSDAFQVKFGRQLVPYSYAWFDHLEQYFIAPERPLFALNFGLSRQAGLMSWGNARGGRLDYAVGGFNGHLTGLADNNPNQEAVAYLNARPFMLDDRRPALRNFNVGASGAIGQVVRDDEPLPMRTSVQAAENDAAANNASAVFLNFNNGVAYRGGRRFAALHMAYYYGGLSFESEWNTGLFQMTRPGLPGLADVPVDGFHASAAYFLTGEEVTRRTTVVPLRPFHPVRGDFGPGAIEPYVRYSRLDLGGSVFRDNLADAQHWTKDVGMVDLGLNWYPTRWVKFYLTWQHAAFGSPVLTNEAKNAYSRTSDLLWLRCQVYF